jgi:ABC-type multidrug transport system ATPase subunit
MNKLAIEPAIQFINVSHSFGTRKVLDDLNFFIRSGELTALRGENGAGKTTLLRLASTLLRPGNGTIKIFDDDSKHNTQKIRPQLGALLDKSRLIPVFSVRENLNFYRHIHACHKASTGEKFNSYQRNIDQLIERFQLQPYLETRVVNLSNGLRRRLQLIMAFCNDCKILLLDEPFNGLDENGIAITMTLIKEIHHRGVTMLIAAHQKELIESLASRTLILDKGKIIEGTAR